MLRRVPEPHFMGPASYSGSPIAIRFGDYTSSTSRRNTFHGSATAVLNIAIGLWARDHREKVGVKVTARLEVA